MISMCWPAGLMLIGVRQQRQEARAPDGELQLALIVSARTGDAARNYLAGFGDVALERRQILVVDLLDVIGRESAELLAAKKTCHVGLLVALRLSGRPWACRRRHCHRQSRRGGGHFHRARAPWVKAR